MFPDVVDCFVDAAAADADADREKGGPVRTHSRYVERSYQNRKRNIKTATNPIRRLQSGSSYVPVSKTEKEISKPQQFR